MIQKYSKFARNYLPYLLLFVFCLVMFCQPDNSFNTDLGRHLKLGEIIWQTHTVPKTNLFSYTEPSYPFINHHWLFEVIVYLISAVFGIQGLLIFKFMALFLITFLIFFINRKNGSALFFVLTFIFLELFRQRTTLRPELISYIFTLLILYILEKHDTTQSKLLYFIPLISLVWVNSHIYFPVGFTLLFIFLADLLFEKYINKSRRPELSKKIRKLAIITVISLAATLVNPNTFNGALYPFRVLNDYGLEITENQSVVALSELHVASPDSLYYYIAFAVIFLSITVGLFRSSFSLKKFLLPLLGLAFATQAMRGFPFVTLISLPYVMQNFNVQVPNFWTKAVNVVAAFVLFAEIIFFLQPKFFGQPYLPLVSKPVFLEDAKPALDYVLSHNLEQPIYNNFDVGSYIIYRGYPKYNVFIDGRPEAYSPSFKKDYKPLENHYAIFKEAERKYKFKTAILGDSFNGVVVESFINTMASDPSWRLVYRDNHTFVFVKNK